MGNSVSQTVRVGIVGAGYVSSYHIRAVQSLGYATVVGIADLNRTQAEEMANKFGIASVYNSLAEMHAAKPDVIHILTPPSSHKALAIEALEMGCHVFVEKPMAETAADCDAMIAKAQEKGLALSVNHSARFDPVILEALDRVKRGECGDILSVDFIRSSEYAPYAGGPLPPPYRNGGYPFQDLGVHGLYLVEAFLGQLREVNAKYYPTGRDLYLTFDEWRCAVEGEKGTGYMMLSWNNRPVQNEIVVHGTKGVLRAECFLQVCTIKKAFPGPRPAQWILNGVFTSLRTLRLVLVNTFRFATGKLRPSPGIHQGVVDFHQALRNNAPLPVSPEEGRRMVAFMEDVATAADRDKEKIRSAQFQPLPPAKILVTGATGFLGSSVLRKLLAKGEGPIRVLVRRSTPALAATGVQIVCGDLGDQAIVEHAMQGIDTVYHVGAAMKGSPQDFDRGTVWGTQNVIDACRKEQIRRLVYVSSLSVMDHAGRNPAVKVTESSAYEPRPEDRGAYTQTKLKAERMVLDAMKQYGLPAVVLRPGQIFGPGAEGVSPSGSIGIAGRWLVVGSGNRFLPLVYVDDVADALILAGEKEGVEGSVFQLVDSTPVTQKEFVSFVQRSRPVKASFVPEWFMMLMATGVETLGKILKRGVPLTKYRVKSIFPLENFDNSAAEQRLGWRPAIGTHEGLARTFPVK